MKIRRPVAGAVDIATQLAREHELHIITARPIDVKPQTETWLKHHFKSGIFKGLHFAGQRGDTTGSGSKIEICRTLGVDFLIEDSPLQSIAIAQGGVPVLLFDCPWNRGLICDGITRIFSWHEVLQFAQPTVAPVR